MSLTLLLLSINALISLIRSFLLLWLVSFPRLRVGGGGVFVQSSEGTSFWWDPLLHPQIK